MIYLSRRHFEKMLEPFPNISHFPTWAPHALEDCKQGKHVWMKWLWEEKAIQGLVQCVHCGKNEQGQIVDHSEDAKQ